MRPVRHLFQNSRKGSFSKDKTLREKFHQFNILNQRSKNYEGFIQDNKSSNETVIHFCHRLVIVSHA